MENENAKENCNAKLGQLQDHTTDNTDELLTTNQGLKINNNQDPLKAGERGQGLLEDFILREKITHFDHERIPERFVHTRGSGAHGTFKPGTIHFINEAYKHCKAIYFGNETDEILKASNVGKKNHVDPAIITYENKSSDDAFINAIANHRVWELEMERNNPA